MSISSLSALGPGTVVSSGPLKPDMLKKVIHPDTPLREVAFDDFAEAMRIVNSGDHKTKAGPDAVAAGNIGNNVNTSA